MLRRASSKRSTNKSATTALATSRRRYTPIWTDPAASDRLSPSRIADECQTLWANHTPYIPTITKAVESWVRYGNDPVLHTAVGREPSSPYLTVEDYIGTNLVRPNNKEHLKESIALWTAHYEKQYASMLRLSRRTAANHVGTLNSPESFVDEADNPQTPWSADTFFRELSFLSERALKEKVATLEQFEQALRRAEGDRFLQFHEHFVTQTQTQIPLPSLSVWHYEGERRAEWAAKYQQALKESTVFFAEKLSKSIATLGASQQQAGWAKVSAAVASSLEKVGAVLVERRARQLKAGIRTPWATMTTEAKDALTKAEVDTCQRSIVEGDFDAEDTTDTSEDWLAEHEKISQLLKETIPGTDFSLGEFWLHTIRLEELSTEHVHTDARAKAISAAARRRMYDEGATPDSVFAATVEAIRKSSLDLRSTTLIPHTNEVWCKLNWAKFGSSTIAHHTTAAKRQLQYHSYDSLRMVSAAAALYFKTKPLSSSLDYSSPFKYRKSFLALCITYGVEQAFATQRPYFGSLANLKAAEDAIATVVQRIARNYGATRRAKTAAALQANQGKVVSIQSVMIPSAEDATAAESMWPFGSKREVRVQWPLPALLEYKANPGTGAEKVIRELALRHKGSFEVALMRQRTPQVIAATVENVKKSFQQGAKATSDLLGSTPQLSEIASAAQQTFFSLTAAERPTDDEAMAAEAKEAQSQWEFATLLTDNAELCASETLSLYLPYKDELSGNALPAGVYCLRIRAFDHANNVDHDPTRCSEVWSTPFQCLDPLPQLLPQFFDKVPSAELATLRKVPGSQLIPFCEFLREAQLDVPVQLEIAVGQDLSPLGEIYLDTFLEKLRSGEHHNVGYRYGYTSKQLEISNAVRSHWQLYHPGANDEEWASARRGELQRAVDRESDWWSSDDMLEGLPNPQNASLTLRYADDVCRLLSATATSARGNVQATYNGSGTLSALEVGPVSTQETFDSLLGEMQDAANRAQHRLCTLSAAKLGAWEKSNQAMVLQNLPQLEFGGQYSRTYRYAFDKATSELQSLGSLSEWSRTKQVDRFASATHPEQRRKTFVAETGSFGQPMDELSPERASNWGNNV